MLLLLLLSLLLLGVDEVHRQEAGARRLKVGSREFPVREKIFKDISPSALILSN